MFTFFSIRDADAFSVVSSKLPAVKRAFDAIADDAPASGEVSPEVRAVSVDHVGLAILGAKRSELFSCKKIRDYEVVETASPGAGGQVRHTLLGPF